MTRKTDGPDQGPKLDTRWVGKDFDDDGTRKRFRRALMRRSRSNKTLSTPYWDSDFNDWLVFESTVRVCGVTCTRKGEDTLEFEADASGVQTEGICAVVVFEIPAREFTPRQLEKIQVRGKFDPVRERRLPGGVWRLDYGPFSDPKNVKRVDWWYDEWEDIEKNGGEE